MRGGAAPCRRPRALFPARLRDGTGGAYLHCIWIDGGRSTDRVYDRRAPKLSEKPLHDRIAAVERERCLDAAIRAWNEFDEKHGSFADDYVKDIL